MEQIVDNIYDEIFLFEKNIEPAQLEQIQMKRRKFDKKKYKKFIKKSIIQ